MEYFKPPEFGKEEEAAAQGHEFSFGTREAATQSEAEAFELEDVEEKKKVKRQKKIDYSQFSSAEFNEVDSLLTNVEEYTHRIREDAERYVHQIREEVDLLKSEIELELANALIKRLNAEREGAAIIQGAEDSKSDIRQLAWEEGFQRGFSEGFENFKAENVAATGQVMSLLKELQGLRLSIFHEYEKQIVKLAMLIAKKVVHNELKTEKNLVLQMVREAMSNFEGMGSVRVIVAPAEYEFIATYQTDLQSFLDDDQVVKVRPDASLPAASAVIESDFSRVHLDLQKQLADIEERLQDCADDRKILFRTKGQSP